MLMQMEFGMTCVTVLQGFRDKLQHPRFALTISFTLGKKQNNTKQKKQETMQQHKAKKFNPWTCLEHVFTLTVSTLPFTSASKRKAVSCEMDGQSVARFPKENRV